MIDTKFMNLAVFLRVIALIIVSVRVLPIMYSETKVNNGLIKLRYLLFGLGLTYTISVIFSLVFTWFHLFIYQMSFINAVNDLTSAMIFYFIYHFNFKGVKRND